MTPLCRLLLLSIVWLGMFSLKPLAQADNAPLSVYGGVDADAATLSNALANKGPDAYQAAREALAARLKKQFPQDYFYWVQKIETASRTQYILAVAAKASVLGPAHPAYQAYLKLNQALSQKTLSVQFVDEIYYSGVLPSRGIYFHDDSEIQLQLLAPDVMFPVLLHELGHAFDPELDYARGDFEDDALKISTLQTKLFAKWSNDEKVFFGHYYFIKMLYLPYLKEIIARLDACQGFTDLRKAGGLPHASRDDLALYDPVMRGRMDCHEWVVADFETNAQYYNIQFEHFWLNQPQYLQLERDAYTRWLNSLSLREFRVPFRYEKIN